MSLRVFLDTNVFIYAFECKGSNSEKIIEFLNKGQIEAVISERVVKEVTSYFEKYHSIKLARIFRRYLLEACTIVTKKEVLEEMDKYKDKIKDKDLEQLAVTKRLGIRCLISYDKDFENFEEYKTPKKFVKLMKVKEAGTEF